MLTAYCLAYGNWTVIPFQWEASFSEISDSGFDAVALSFSESEMRYSRLTFERQVEALHERGLKAFVIPSRIGGRFAGAPLMPCIWLTEHPEFSLPGRPWLACIESEPFREWCRDFVGTILRDYDIDGIFWDEPKNPNLVSYHPDTLAAYGPEPREKDMHDGFIDFLEELSSFCKSISPGLFITMFNTRQTSEYFTRKASSMPSIDCCGYDGNCSKTSYFREEPRQHKYLLLDVWERTLEECRTAGKKSFGLVENMLVPESEHETYRRELDKYLSTASPDHLAVYYYGHNNENPEAMHRMTMEILSRWRV